MAHITVEPQGKIWLCKCALEADLKNTFTFANATAQLNYFEGLQTTIIAGDDYTYVRKDNKVRVEIPYDDIDLYNYMWYVNRGFNSPKRYFCFIDRLEYVNENVTDIYFHTDVFQTWIWNLTWNRCFVEREHVNDDTVGANTVPEGLETGDFVCNDVLDDPLTKVDTSIDPSDASSDFVYIIAASCRPEDTYSTDDPLPYYNNTYTVYNGIYSGNTYFRTTTPTATELSGWLNSYAQNGTSEAITSIFVAPKWLAPKRANKLEVDRNYTVTTRGASISMNSTLDGYTPKNNKLFTGEYNYCVVTNNNGASNVLKWEYWGQGAYEVSGAICPGCSIRFTPMYYKNATRNTEEGLTLGKYPVCSWKVDSYTNWLTQNSINVGGATISKDELNMVTSVASLATGTALLATGAGAGIGTGMVMGGLAGVANNMYAMKQHNSIVPSSAGNTNAGDVTFAMSKTCFSFYKMSIRAEYARIIDNFFSAYGYKVNRIKVPNITGRSQWNFVKTVDCNVNGDVPQEDLQTIRSAMDRGVTFWHNPANIYNYSLNNPIV